MFPYKIIENQHSTECMSILISTADQINRAPTNQSQAKMLYSFGKGPRFVKNQENQCHEFYEVQSAKSSKRATSLGYGNKYDFTRDMPKTPAPGSYEAESVFEKSRKSGKGFGFGSGRNEMKATAFIKKNQNPGPGAYEYSSTRSNIHPSMKGKGKIDNREQICVPGPGTYENMSSFSKTGELFSSRFKSKPACRFAKDEKLKINNYLVPGPGTYQSTKTEFSPEGKYYLSRLQSAKSTKFGKSLKLDSKDRCKTPGPGTYRLPSQFGYYINRKAFEELSNSNVSKTHHSGGQEHR